MSAERFRLQIGDNLSIGGEVTWGNGGWLVSDGTTDYQAAPEQPKTEAVLAWLRLRLIDGDA